MISPGPKKKGLGERWRTLAQTPSETEDPKKTPILLLSCAGVNTHARYA